ncbi:hypothetical protein [Caldalkalibacillus mannanilyticus]|uniref:hypothetical protein n=1 Tax=Caldalkalibacillus mannanilyticus TaxID=1418 RepID=UPI00046AFA4D|nr:hypothetical protein [Caldalkalibacillus mannanilyticus]
MNLRNKTIIIIGILMLFLVLTLSVVMKMINLNSFRQLEERFVYENIKRVVNKIQVDLAHLNSVALDWAAWMIPIILLKT